MESADPPRGRPLRARPRRGPGGAVINYLLGSQADGAHVVCLDRPADVGGAAHQAADSSNLIELRCQARHHVAAAQLLLQALAHRHREADPDVPAADEVQQRGAAVMAQVRHREALVVGDVELF